MSVTNISTGSELDAARQLGTVSKEKSCYRQGRIPPNATNMERGGSNIRQRYSFAVCETSADVQTTVRTAREHGFPLSVRGGGHDWAGRSLRHGGLVIDLSHMRHVVIDPVVRIATVQGGATAAGVIAAARPHGLVAATGNCGGVGMAGLTLGGGYGPLNGQFGLALDNLVSAEVVLADGRIVTADATHEPELFWALRGGGGNFGVVTSMVVRLHPVDQLIGGLIVFPWSQAAAVWRG